MWDVIRQDIQPKAIRLYTLGHSHIYLRKWTGILAIVHHSIDVSFGEQDALHFLPERLLQNVGFGEVDSLEYFRQHFELGVGWQKYVVGYTAWSYRYVLNGGSYTFFLFRW